MSSYIEFLKNINQNTDTIDSIDISKIRTHFFKNDKILILTKPKVAHSWCRDIFIEKNLDINTDTSFLVNFITLDILTYFTDDFNKKYFDEISPIWTNFLNKNEKRDLILLYRNPFENWMSAFIQDYIRPLVPRQEVQSPYFIKFIRDIHSIETSIKEEFILECKSSNSYDKIFYQKYKKIMYEIYRIQFQSHLNNGIINSGHYFPWITFIYKLINSNKIDSSKIKLIDIYESPLEIQLSPYIEMMEFDESNIKNNNSGFDIMYKLISESNYKNKIIDSLSDEINLYYDIKENYKDFHMNHDI